MELGLAAILGLSLILGAEGCNSGGGSGGGLSVSNGNLQLLFTDSPFPFDIVQSAFVTVSEVSVQAAGAPAGTWVPVLQSPTRLDLVRLRNGATQALAQLNIPAGNYDQIRVSLSESTVILSNGTALPVTVPPNASSGIRLALAPALTTTNSSVTQLLVDFDLSGSFTPIGTTDGPSGFSLTPSLRAVSLTSAGRVSGTLTEDHLTPGNSSDDTKFSGVLVSARQGGVTVASAVSDARGFYKMIGLLPGQYELVLSHPAMATRTISGVYISSGTETYQDVLVALSSHPKTQAPYFGYFANDNSITENYDHSNLNHITPWGRTGLDAINDILGKLATTRSLGSKAILTVESFVFTSPAPGRYALEPDASSKFAQLVDSLETAGYLVAGHPEASTVVAFYVLDEPALYGLGDLDGAAHPAHANAINAIKSNPKSAKFATASIQAGDFANNMRQGMRLFDWVGFDDYGQTNNLQPGKKNDSLKSLLDLSRQRVILVPQAGTGHDLDNSADSPYEYYEAAKNDPAVVLLMPFIWWSRSGGWTGTADSPSLRAAYTDIGKRIKESHP